MNCQANAVEEACAFPPGAERMRILLLEDSMVDAHLLEAAFPNQVASIDIVTTLEAGRRHLSTFPYDLIFLDLLLPDSHGLDKISEIQAMAPETPVVVITGMADSALARKALHLGADDYLLKSEWTPSLLERAARQALDRARARKDLLQSERWMKAICNASRDGILVEHAESIVFANQACAELFGYESVMEMLGQSASGLCTAQEKQRMMEYGRQRESGGDAPHIYEFQGSRKNGSTLEAEVSASAFTLQGKNYIISVIRNIEERKHLEESLRQARQMEAIGRLAGGVAHDFNNLLMIIRGYAELLRDEVLVPEAAKKVEEILTASGRAANLTRELLTVGRRQMRRPAIVDLHQAIAKLGNALPGIFPADLRFHLPPVATPLRVRMDPDHLERVLLNLALNAKDAMPARGDFRVELAKQRIERNEPLLAYLANPGWYALLTVRDTGSGISPEALPLIFEPFFSTKERGKGTGLGLSMVYAIVKQAGGHVTAESAIGEGATFRIWLPLVEDPAEDSVETGQNTARKDLPAGTETILLVEDETPLRRLAESLLREIGYTVISAANGEEALQAARDYREPIHLLLTDVIMPVINGREVAESICASRPETKVLYMSGFSDQILARKGGLPAGIELLEKPFTRNALAQRIRQVIDSGKDSANQKL